MKITKRKVAIITGITFLGLASSVFIFAKNDSLPLQKVEGFNYIEPGEPQCRALSPQCGYCSGKVIGKDCWVWKSKKSNQPADACTAMDRNIKNCVPAGLCAPTPQQDALIDCALKDYDRKFNTDL